jgi:site-specific DNA recombinase
MQENKNVEEILRNAKKLAVYKRVSTDEQDNEKRQNGALDYYLDKKGVRLADMESFEDTKSAYRLPYEKREKFVSLIEAARANEIDGVIVSDIDRISRQTSEHFQLRKLFDELGLPVIIASNGEIYGKSDTKDLIKHLIEDGLTKLESDNNSVRTRDTLEKLRGEGKYAGGVIPYGYLPEKKEVGNEWKVVGVMEVPEEMKVVKQIFKLYQGGGTFKSISKTLKDEGTPGKWSEKKVKYILSNPFYTGHFVYHRKTGNRSFAPLIDWVWATCPWIENPPITKELFLACWKRYERSKNENRHFLHTPFYFQGVIHCLCGEPMKGLNQQTKSKTVSGEKDGFRYYKCRCGIKIEAESLHKLFIRFYENLSFPFTSVSREVTGRLLNEKEHLVQQIESWEKQLEKEEQLIRKMKVFREIKDSKNVLLTSSKEPMDIALLIAKKQADQTIENLKKQLQEGRQYLQGLETSLDRREELQQVIEDSLSYVTNQDQLMRSLVILMVKDCQLITDHEVSLTFYMMPDNVLSPVITRQKRAD